jgi:hypothetical protein
MRGLSGFIVMAAVVLLASVSPAVAAVTPKSATVKAALPPPASNPAPCTGVDEMPDINGLGGCNKIPGCNKKGQAYSYDTKTGKIVCKTVPSCDPSKGEELMYSQEKNETTCFVARCKDGQHLTLIGNTMSCK